MQANPVKVTVLTVVLEQESPCNILIDQTSNKMFLSTDLVAELLSNNLKGLKEANESILKDLDSLLHESSLASTTKESADEQ